MSSNDWCGTPKADALWCDLHKMLNEHNAHDILGELYTIMSFDKTKGVNCGHNHPCSIMIVRNGMVFKACPCGAHWRE